MKKYYRRTYTKRVGQADALRPKKSRKVSAYKSVDSYLDAVWKNNPMLNERIAKLNDPRPKKKIFKDRIKEYLNKINPETGKKYTVKQALDRFQRSETITSAERRRSEVAMTRIKEQSPEDWKNIRKAIGWKNKFDVENVIESWSEGKLNYFRYKDKNTGRDILIVEEISPKKGFIKTEILDYGQYYLDRLKEKMEQGDVAAAAEYEVMRILVERRIK